MSQASAAVGVREAPTLSVVTGAAMLELMVFELPLTTLDPTARRSQRDRALKPGS